MRSNLRKYKINGLDCYQWLLAMVLVCGVGLEYLAISSEMREVPLYTAAREQKWDKVKEMLRNGANPNDTSDLQNFRTALYRAIPEGQIEIARLLIEKRVDVNRVDTHGQTALDWADFDGTGQQAGRREFERLSRRAGATRGDALRTS